MKNLFLISFAILLTTMSLTSCSVNSLEEEGLIIEEKTSTQARLGIELTITLYVKWEANTSENDQNHLRQDLFSSNKPIKLYSYTVNEEKPGYETWEITFTCPECKSTDPILWLEDETVIEVASTDPI